MLPDRSWRISYSSNENNPIAEFYVPALECAVQYDRKSGFFNSAILSKVARGLGAMLHNQGKIRLIMGCQFSPDDLEAIEKGYALREVVTDRLATDLQPPTNFVQLKHLEILSWLIETGSLDIKIAIPLKTNGRPTDDGAMMDNHHIFHEKVGIFTDVDDNKLVFSGSNNESVAGWEHNVESFHVYCDWEGGRDQERVAEETARFDRLWLGSAPNVSVFELPEAVRRKLLTYTPKFTPDWNPQIELDIDQKIESEQPATSITPIIPDPITIAQEQKLFDLLANLHQHPGCLDFCLKSIPISPWAHQLKILRRVATNFPCNFLIADEVGLGKTIETGLILKYLLTSQKVQRVLLLVPASVQVQWQQELREKFNLHFWSYSQGEFTAPDHTTITPTSNPWNTTNLILASSHLIQRSVDAVSVKQNRAQELLAAEHWDLVILDEAHHARRRSPQQRKDTPNRLLSLLQRLKDQTKSLMLLSATPMQIDPVEIFDLLNLLGLSGHWSYSENFCDYFATLSNSNITKETLDFWQQMSTDYFRRGGKPCPRLDRY